MRILLVSDIHANRAALDAIQEPFDLCLCMGDIVEYGPEPGPCVEWVRTHANHVVRGNHDHGTAQNVDVQGAGGFRYLTQATRTPTLAGLTGEERSYLNDLPTTDMFRVQDKQFMIVHATPRDPLDEYLAPDPAQWALRLAGLKVDFVCVGHTHQPFVLVVNGIKVINPGAVGLQRDGDPRVRYAIMEDDKIELKEVAYDVEATVTAVKNHPLIEDRAKRMLEDVYRLGRITVASNGVNGTNGKH